MQPDYQFNAGYLYIANTQKYLKEATVSVKSLRSNTKFPICLITTKNLASSVMLAESLFDELIILPELEGLRYNSKIIGIPLSPFENTIFLDTDTFICSNIDGIFDILSHFDLACTIEQTMHTSQFSEDKEKLRFKEIFPELNTGLIAYIKNDKTKRLFNQWKLESEKMHTDFDMPPFREAVLNCPEIKFCILPAEFNFHGFNSYVIAFQEIKVIHGRFGERWNTLTLIAEDYERMLTRSKKMNRYKGKRIYIPYLGFVPASLNLYRLTYKFKKFLGIKLTSKRNTY